MIAEFQANKSVSKAFWVYLVSWYDPKKPWRTLFLFEMLDVYRYYDIDLLHGQYFVGRNFFGRNFRRAKFSSPNEKFVTFAQRIVSPNKSKSVFKWKTSEPTREKSYLDKFRSSCRAKLCRTKLCRAKFSSTKVTEFSFGVGNFAQLKWKCL